MYKIDDKLLLEFKSLYQEKWKYVNDPWPIFEEIYHRTKIKCIDKIKKIKDFVHHCLGTIPVYFFLTQLFGAIDYCSPYNNVEKGILLLYQLMKGYSLVSIYSLHIYL